MDATTVGLAGNDSVRSDFVLIGTGKCTAGLECSLSPGEQVVIGRHRDCTLVVPADAGSCDAPDLVSRQHAVVAERTDGTWSVYDNASQNGTTILCGGLPPAIRLNPGIDHTLQNGDVIELAGNADFRLNSGAHQLRRRQAEMALDSDVEGLTRRLKSAHTPEERERLWEELFPRLHRIAERRIDAAGRSHQESATELVNNVFPGLQRALDNPATRFTTRGDFMAYAATAMRRHRASQVRRRMAEEVLNDDFAVETASPETAIAISDALDTLAERLPRAVRAFELREYGGYSYDEIIEILSAEYRTKALLAADLTLVRKSLAVLLRGIE